MASRSPPPSSARALEQARLRLEEALAANPDDVRLLVLKARADARTRRFSEAAGYFQRAAALQREEGDRAGEAASLLEAADALTRDGYGAEARVTYNRAIGCFELLGDEGSVARSRMALARHHLGRREHHEARPLLERCLRVLAAAGQHDELGWVRERLADIASAAKQPQQALEHARLAVEAAAKAKDRVAFGARLALVAALHRQAGNAAKARSYLEKALPHLRAAEDRLPLLDALVTLA